MTRFVVAVAALTIVGLVNVARAAEDPTGTWKWSTTINDKSVDSSLKLKLEGDKLSGVYVGRGNTETPIEDATWKDDAVSFKVTRMFNDTKFVIKYSGKVSGDTITGKSEFEREGQAQSRDWVAKRQK